MAHGAIARHLLHLRLLPAPLFRGLDRFRFMEPRGFFGFARSPLGVRCSGFSLRLRAKFRLPLHFRRPVAHLSVSSSPENAAAIESTPWWVQHKAAAHSVPGRG